MSDIAMDVLIILLGGFFVGLMVYAFYIALKPKSRSMADKKGQKKPATR